MFLPVRISSPAIPVEFAEKVVHIMALCPMAENRPEQLALVFNFYERGNSVRLTEDLSGKSWGMCRVAHIGIPGASQLTCIGCSLAEQIVTS